MKISELAKSVNVAATTLRFYERAGLLPRPDRTRAGYRDYDAAALQRLRFIRSAQAVGFTLQDIRALLELNGDTPCKQVRSLIERRLADVDAKLTDLKRVRTTLADALERCRRSRQGCGVVADLKRKSTNGRSK